MYRLQNEFLTAEFDDQARLTFLANQGQGIENILDTPAADSFQLVFRKGDDWENAVFGRNQTFTVKAGPDELVFTCGDCLAQRAAAKITVVLRVRLDGPHLCFSATLENLDEVLVTDFTYPMVGVIRSLGGQKPPGLLMPNHCGECYPNVGEYLSQMAPSREAHPQSIVLSYPGGHGRGASMQWMALTDDAHTLAFSGRDPLFYTSEFRVEGSAADRGAITMMLTKLPFVKQGEQWEAPPVLLSLYRGSWHLAAREYREWAETWRNVHPVPEWIRNMRGYFLVINKQQFGAEMWRYDELPALYERAQAHGFDTLGLFGWYDSGHDNQYPDLKVSETLGGADCLRENIRKVQQAGGHVTLYQQGHLMDITTDYYKNGGYRYESVSRWGMPYFEEYNKSHKSEFLQFFTNKVFSNACPSCPEWQELMEEKTDFAASFGADGVLFDQIGGMYAYPCFNESHPHAHGKPSLSMSQGRIRLLDRIQKRTKEKDPEFCFMTEHVTDLYSAYVDCLHGMHLSAFPQGAREKLAEGTEPGCINYPELFRYCFPATAVTLRNPRPYVSPREANYAFLFGLKMEMEVRYQADKNDLLADRWPEYREYAKKVDTLRARYWDIFSRGEYRDIDPLENPDTGLLAKAYVKGNCMVTALWNDSEQAIALHGLQAPGWKFKEASDPENTFSQMPEELAAGDIMAVLYEKEGEGN